MKTENRVKAKTRAMTRIKAAQGKDKAATKIRVKTTIDKDSGEKSRIRAAIQAEE